MLLHKTILTSFITVAGIAACQQGAPSGKTESRNASALGAAKLDPGTKALCDASMLSDKAGAFLVTPRWSPAGDRLLVSGKNGRGLFSLDLAGRTLTELDSQALGRVFWSKDGRTVQYRRSGSGEELQEMSFASRLAQPIAAAARLLQTLRLSDAVADAEVIFEAEGSKLVYEEYRGRIAVVEDGKERVLVEGGAWEARTSPDGKLVAYCEGHLEAPALKIIAGNGEKTEVGPGAHPAWFSDGRRLVYTVPVAVAGQDGHDRLAGADLFLYDAVENRSARLTETAGVTEMEPAVSAGGVLACSDWASGALITARLCGEGEREAGGR